MGSEPQTNNKAEDADSSSDDNDSCLEACANIELNHDASVARKHRKYTPCCLFKTVVLPLVALFVISYLVNYFFLGGNSNLPPALQGILPDIDPFRHEDPLNGQVYTWPPTSTFGNDGGLELTLLNCLDDTWHPYFDLAVQQWDDGSPDVLTLDTQLCSPDPTCTRRSGVIKVCNGNYGETEWKGINEVLMENDHIVSSTARMNEYFLGDSSSDAERQYTMCHEIGKNEWWCVAMREVSSRLFLNQSFSRKHIRSRFWLASYGRAVLQPRPG